MNALDGSTQPLRIGVTNCPAAAVVVQIHQGPGILHCFLFGIHEFLCKFDSIVDVVAAASPVKLPSFVFGAAPLVGITTTGLEFALAASPGDGVHNSC